MKSRGYWTARTFSTTLIAFFLCAGCDANDARAQESVTHTVNATTAAQKTKVTKIVFVGKEHACDCTRTRVDEAWKVLQQALGKPTKLPVQRLRIDTQAENVAPYQKLRPIIALPAMYFLDSKNKVVEVLQGEVTLKQVNGAIGKG